ncbi:MAG: type II secretion system protein N [Pseudomonadota bacterium]
MRRLFLMFLIGLFLLAILLTSAVWVLAQTPMTTLQETAGRHLPLPAPLARMDVEGSLGRGQIKQVSLPRVAGVDLGPADFQWELRPLQAITGRMVADVEASAADGQFQAVASRGLSGWRVADGQGRMSAATLGRMLRGAGLNDAELGGILSLDLHRLELTDEGEIRSASGRLHWNNAVIQADRSVRLGNLAGDFTAQGHEFNGTFTDQGGPLALQGKITGHLTQGRMHIEATASPRNQDDPALAHALSQVGEQRGNAYVIRLQRP